MTDRSSRQDLDHALAVIAVDPKYISFMQSGPAAQTMEGWQEHQRGVDALMDELEAEIVRIASAGILSQGEDFPRHYYQIGPACQGPHVELIELIQNANAIIETVVTYVDLGTFAFQIREWWTQRVGKTKNSGSFEAALILTAPFIEGMCVADVVKRHGETRVRQVQSHSRQDFLGSPAHPTGSERYTVAVSVKGPRHYIYTVDGMGNVSDHYLMNEGEVIPLDMSDWKKTAYSDLSREPHRPHKVLLGDR